VHPFPVLWAPGEGFHDVTGTHIDSNILGKFLHRTIIFSPVFSELHWQFKTTTEGTVNTSRNCILMKNNRRLKHMQNANVKHRIHVFDVKIQSMM